MDAAPSAQELAVKKELKRLQQEYKRDRNAADSKYGQDFLFKILTECNLLAMAGNPIMKMPEISDRLKAIRITLEDMKERQPFSATEEEVDNAEALLNEAVAKLENKL